MSALSKITDVSSVSISIKIVEAKPSNIEPEEEEIKCHAKGRTTFYVAEKKQENNFLANTTQKC